MKTDNRRRRRIDYKIIRFSRFCKLGERAKMTSRGLLESFELWGGESGGESWWMGTVVALRMLRFRTRGGGMVGYLVFLPSDPAFWCSGWGYRLSVCRLIDGITSSMTGAQVLLRRSRRGIRCLWEWPQRATNTSIRFCSSGTFLRHW